MQKLVKITINNKQYSISTDEEEDVIYCASQLVDSLVKNCVDKNQPSDFNRATLLVALQLATDLAKHKKLLQVYNQKTEALISLLAKEV